MSKDIIEENKLIAEFMGFYESGKDPVWKTTVMVAKDGQTSFVIGEMQYHTSWDWLMPVVEKIESNETGANVSIYMRFCSISEEGMPTITIRDNKSKIENTWQAVIQFIQWYNSKPVNK